MTKLHELAKLRQSVWYDNIRRGLIDSGELQALVDAGVRGVTSNPSIFEKAIAGSDDYDAALSELVSESVSAVEIYEALAIKDIQRAADILRPVYDESDGLDGYVSLEVSPTLAHDTDGTIADARRLFAALDRPNIMIKIPATPAGLPAITTLIGEGININVTLIFSLDQYRGVIEAYIAGLEALVSGGGEPEQVASVASFFVSRIDSAVDRALDDLQSPIPNPSTLLRTGPQSLKGKIAVASAKAAYAMFQQAFAGEQWERLAARGARVQRPLWASTSTKSPAYPDTLYVDTLIGPHTVNTMPPATVDAFLDHGTVALTVEQDADEAHAHLAQLAELGIDLDTITQKLLDDGVAAFAKSFESLMASVEEKCSRLQVLEQHLAQVGEAVVSQINSNVEPATIIIFGASGDLTRRKLVPALHSLACEGLLQPDSRVVGVARSSLSDQDFRDHLYEGVRAYARLKPGICELWSAFEDRFSYLAGSYDDVATYRRLTERLNRLDAETSTGGNRLFYLATPPSLYPIVVEQLGQSGLNRAPREGAWTRVIIEKPFGHDLASAQKLNEQAHAVFDESQVYRIDHYLGKETVQNILTLRFANTIFEPLWNRNYVDHVQITVAESVDVGHRAGYYDKAGVLRDMFQNHLLQLLTLTAMEPPAQFEAKALRDEKVKVLRAVRAGEQNVRAQYGGYCSTESVAADSQTPTYAALQLFVDNWRWRGVPFYLRSGKSLAAKTTEVAVQFKCVPHLMFPLPPGERMTPNVLSICLQPDEGIHLRFEAKEPGAGMRARSVDMEFHYDEDFGSTALPEAYERLLLDALQGDASLFARADEIELAWGIVDPILAGWARVDAPPPAAYEPGSWGPDEADEMLRRDGRTWLLGCGHG